MSLLYTTCSFPLPVVQADPTMTGHNSNLYYAIQRTNLIEGESNPVWGISQSVEVTFQFGWALSYDRPTIYIYYSPDNTTPWEIKQTTYLYEDQPYWYYSVVLGDFEKGQDVYFFLYCDLTTEGSIPIGYAESVFNHFTVSNKEIFSLNYMTNSSGSPRWGVSDALDITFQVPNSNSFDPPLMNLYHNSDNSSSWTINQFEQMASNSDWLFYGFTMGYFTRGEPVYFYVNGSVYNGGNYLFDLSSKIYNFSAQWGPLLSDYWLVPEVIWPQQTFQIQFNASDTEFGLSRNPIVVYGTSGFPSNFTQATLISGTTYTATLGPFEPCNLSFYYGAVNDADNITASELYAMVIDFLPSSVTCNTSINSLFATQNVIISGQLNPNLSAEEIVIQESDDGIEWNTLSSVYTDDSGQYTYNWTTDSAEEILIRAVWFGDAHHYSGISEYVQLNIDYNSIAIYVSLDTDQLYVGDTLHISGTISCTTTPTPDSVQLTVKVLSDDGITIINSNTVMTNESHTFVYNYVTSESGDFSVQVIFNGDEAYSYSSSPLEDFTVLSENTSTQTTSSTTESTTTSTSGYTYSTGSILDMTLILMGVGSIVVLAVVIILIKRR